MPAARVGGLAAAGSRRGGAAVRVLGPAAPFRAGAHRGADFAATAGARVRAACAGAVVTAGMGVVTLRCGPWRVTALPLGASPPCAQGARVRAGAALGRLGTLPGHTGLHLGVRRAGDRFAYVDPVPLLGGAPAPPAGGAASGPAGRAAPAAGARRASRVSSPRAHRARRGSSLRARARGRARALARLGRARVVGVGAVGGGLRLRARVRLASLAGAAADAGTVSDMIAALLIGFGLGASVAAQLGPMSLLTIRSTLRNGVGVGLAIGAGIAVIDTLYAAAGPRARAWC